MMVRGAGTLASNKIIEWYFVKPPSDELVGHSARVTYLALLFTMGALLAFLIEMLLASRGLRDQADYATEVGDMHELVAEGVREPTRGESG